MRLHHQYPQSIVSYEIELLNGQQLNLRELQDMDFIHRILIVVLHGQQRHIYGQPEAVFLAYHQVQALLQVQRVRLVRAVMILLVLRMAIA